MFYTYLWLRENGIPYYVGKGSGKRAFVERRSKGVIKKPPLKNRIVIYPALSEKDALETEIALIWYYGRKDLGTGYLINLTDGGENPPNHKGIKRTGKNLLDIVERNKNRASIPVSQETRHKMASAKLGKPGNGKGIPRKFDKEWRQNLALAMKGNTNSKGKPWSPARRAAQDRRKLKA